MSDFATIKQNEVTENYKEFQKLLPALAKDHCGEFVLMRNRKIVEFFDTARDAMVYAAKTFPDNIFSVQEVTDKPVDLGWFSHAPVQQSLRS